MRYQEIEPVTQIDASSAFDRGSPDELLAVVLSVAMYEVELSWAQEFCTRLAAHPHPTVRGNAVLGFGHLARRFGSLEPAAVPIVRAALRDGDEYVRAQAHAAADDLNHFLGLQLA